LTDLIPHLVYHIKNKYLEQLIDLILDVVAAVRQYASKHVDRDGVHKENPTRCNSVSKFYFIFI
jgi:hypothetical protein